MVKNKKSQTMLVPVVLTMVIILILSIFVYKFYSSAKDKLAIQDCKNSISAHALVLEGTRGEVFSTIKCPTRNILIDNKDPIKAKEKIAQDMHRCWYEWGRGDGAFFKGDGIFCHICAIYDFKEKGTQLKGFAEYIQNTKLPQKYLGDPQGWTYKQYLSAKNSNDLYDQFSKKAVEDLSRAVDYSQSDYINTNLKYATIYVHANGKGMIEKALEGHKAGITAASGIAIGLGISAAGGAIAVYSTATTIGLSMSWNPIGWIVLTGVGVAVAGTAILSYVWTLDDNQYISMLTFREYTSETINSIGCTDFPVSQVTKG